MYCPFCSSIHTKVIDSRLVNNGARVRRRRQCLVCYERITTFEIPALIMPCVLKNNCMREPFNESKLSSGIMKALEKRPISNYKIERLINHIKNELRNISKREIPSKIIGILVMDELKKLDKVAYIRFTSVHRSFENIYDFNKEIARLEGLKHD